MNQFDIVIIGAGPSGIYAATYAALKKLHVLVTESSDVIGGQPRQLYGHKKVYDFPGHLVTTGEEIVENLIKQQSRLSQNIKYLLQTTVSSWKHDENKAILLELSNGQKIQSKAMIISTGSGSLIPTQIDANLIDKSVDQNKISYYVNEFSNYVGKDVVILGGGDSAVEWAWQLAASHEHKPKSVSIIHRRPEYRANAKYVEHLRQEKVNEYLDSEITCIKHDFIEIINNNDQSITQIKYDKIIVQYGLKQQKPVNDLWKDFEKIGIKFLTDRNQQTSKENIYAIGFATHYNGRPNLLVTGMAEAVVAVKAINAKINPYGTDYIDNN